MTKLASLVPNSEKSIDFKEVPGCPGASLAVSAFSWQFSLGGWANEKSARSLGLSNSNNSHKAANKKSDRADRGQGGITAYGRKLVRAAAAYMEYRYGRSLLTFGTLTIPKLLGAELALCNQMWHELVRQFVQELRRLLRRRGLPPIVVHVSEIQEKRLEEYGDCAMHLHYLHPGRQRGKAWGISCAEVRRIWCRLLQNLLGREIEDGCIAATRVERVRCSAAQYLGKYMSKGIGSLKQAKDMGFADQLPAAWWGMSNALKSLIKDFSHRFTNAESTLFLDNIPFLIENGIIKWILPIYREIQIGECSHEVVVGYAGQLTGEAAFEFLRGNLSLEEMNDFNFQEVA